MPVAPHIKELMSSSSFIRKMFEEGIQLKARFGADKVYDFSLGNPDLEPPAKVKRMLADLASSGAKGLHGYMPNAGYPETRAAMAAKVSAEQGVTVDFSHIVMGVGAAGAMNAVLKAILSPGDEVIVPSPYFVEYTHYTRNHGGVLKPVPTNDDFSPDIEAIRAALTEKTAALIINSPNNPTGKIYSRADIAGLSAALADHEKKTGRTVLLIADEPYREIVYDNREVAPVFPAWPASVVVTSFAKNLSLPGERIGYAAINPACADAKTLVDAIIFSTRILGYVNAPATFQKIVAECWNEPVDYSSYLIRRNKLTAILDRTGIGYSVPEGAFYLFCKVPSKGGEPADDGAFCDHLKKYNILGVPGTGFGRRGWFRLAYCVPEATIDNCAEAFRDACKDW
jgi:aspartate aminotransferase